MKLGQLLQLFVGTLILTPLCYAGKPGYPNDALAAQEAQPTLENCLHEKRATVVGASVTLGFFGDSPSMLYLERAGFKHNCIQKKSFPIGDSEDHFKWLQKSVNDFKPEVVVALDYLIHDVSFVHDEQNISARVEKSNKVIEYLSSLNIPVVIGTVFSAFPEKYPFQKSIAVQLNQSLCAKAAADPKKFFVLPIARIYRQLYSDQYVPLESSSPVKKEEVLVDMYHPGPRGAYMLTNTLIDKLNSLAESDREFPYSVKPYKEKEVLRQAFDRPILQSLNPMAHEKTLFTKKGEDTLKRVNETTIPDELGDEACNF
ncbi:MAG: hypothetical protein ACXVAX_02715 [Pseudobdellovibrio sp.]